MKNKASVILTGVVFVVICLLVLIPTFFLVIVDAGEIGVISVFGNVEDVPLYPGLQIKSPFANIIKMSTRTTEYTMASASDEGFKAGDDSIQARASDGATVWLDVTVFFHLNPESAAKVYKELGIEYEEKIIRPEIRSEIREVAAAYKINEIYSIKRIELTEKIKEGLTIALDARGISVEDVLLRKVTLTSTLTDSIEEKLTAQQEAQKLDFLLEKEEKEAKRKVIEAGGQRDAQTIISKSLTDRYLYYLYILNLKEHEGTIYVPTEGGVPLFKNIK